MGNRVSAVGDSLTIRIGGDPEDKKKPRKANKIISTKYNPITFLPQNLLEQFRRIANFYFLVMTCITIIIDSPVSPLTSLLPLVFVITVTAAKQGYEDFLRHKADNTVNLSFVTLIRDGVEVDVKCQEISPGDLVKVPRDCDIPCDLVLLKSSEPNGKCHITTANLDGESNLKTLNVPKNLPNVEINKLHTLGVIECELPQTDLYTFNGKIEVPANLIRETLSQEERHKPINNVLPLMADNTVLRGSRVKNTEWAIGCAVYTGSNTKLALNSKITRNKMSSSEKFINKFLVFFLVLLVIIVTTAYFIKRYMDKFRSGHNHYLGEPVPNYQVAQFLQDYFSFLILFNYIIPISLYVTIEMHKFMGSFFMEWDPDLYDEDTNQPCIVNTSDLNEELGQVRLLFSDKTGTLTKNEMNFQQFSANGRMFVYKGHSVQDAKSRRLYKIHDFNPDLLKFFEALSICHTVQIAGESQELFGVDGESSATPAFVVDYNFREEDDIATAGDSDPEEVDFVPVSPRISNDSNVSRPLSLSEFERISMKNNITKPLLRSNGTVRLPDPNAQFLDKTSEFTNPTNVNEAPDNRATRFSDKVSKRPVSEIFNRNEASQSNGDLTVNQSRSVNGLIEEMDESPSVSQRNSLSNTQTNLKRTTSANEYDNKDRIRKFNVGHRRTQSHAVTGSNRLDNTPSSTLQRQINSRNSLLANSRDSYANTREYYAAPSYNEASLLERKESVLRRGVLKSVIDLLDYQASSPDEKALVEACAQLGYVFTGDDDEVLTIDLKTEFMDHSKTENFDTVDDGLTEFKDKKNIVKYKRLAVLEFTSDRKRMSVIVKDQKGKIWLITKGAESHVLPLCNGNTASELVQTTQQHINEFAKQGLRTLAVARRQLTSAEFAEFNEELLQANNSLNNRKALVEECQRKLETNLNLLGATAVEDALQDNARDTLESLRAAGIKVWVLTGDKVETALNIALSCGHIPETAFKYFITECKTQEHINEHLELFNKEMAANPEGIYTLLIDGSSLAVALKGSEHKFRDTAIKCRAVLCCRLSPLQKCEVVQLMKTVQGKPITAAIGDGANDVSMIQEAHVGLGIVGKEGRQAARCADYAFANFSMVKKILLVHGHYYSQRLAMLVLYFFYKNLVFMSIQFFFQISSLFSSQSIYDSLYLTLYNVIFTALPILFISLTEKVFTEKQLMESPELYQKITKNKALTWKYFCGWMALALYHGIVIYMFAWVMFTGSSVILTTPVTLSLSCFGTFLMHNVVVLVNIKLWLQTHYQSYWFIGTIWLSILSFVVITLVYNVITSWNDLSMLHVYTNLLSSLTFWLLSFVTIITALIPDYTLKVCKAFHVSLGPIMPGTGSWKFRSRKLKRQVQITSL